MKRLFTIRNRRTGTILPDEQGHPQYFEKKTIAKGKRDLANQTNPGVYAVSLGPDHRRYQKQ